MSSDSANVTSVVQSAIQRTLPWPPRALSDGDEQRADQRQEGETDRMGASARFIWRAPPVSMAQVRAAATPISMAKA